MAGSCEWILESPEYGAFACPGDSTILTILGRPGEGKTFLATFVVETLLQETHSQVLYFFCKAGDPEKRTALRVVRTLLAQLLRSDIVLSEVIEEIYYNSGHLVAESLTDVRAALGLVLQASHAADIYVIVDGLDECQDNLELTQILLEVSSNAAITRKALHLMFCSRDHADILSGLKHHSKFLKLDDTYRIASIRAYALQRLSSVKILSDQGLHQWAAEQVCSAARGLWLYARLLLDEIQYLPNISMIQHQLRNIPRGLQQLYTQILTTLASTLNDWQLAVAQQIFLWIDISKFVLNGATESLSLDVLEIVLQYVSMGEPVHDPIPLIRKLGSHLVDTFEDYDGSCTIDFIHHTTRQYVEWSSTAPLSQVPVILKPRRLRQLHCGAIAAWYFSQHPQVRSDCELVRLHFGGTRGVQYFEMTYALWGAFKLAAPPTQIDAEESSQIAELCNRLIQFISSDQCLTWIEMAVLVNYSGGYSQLLENVQKALAVSSEVPASTYPSFEAFRQARRVFFEDYAHVIWETGPEACLDYSKDKRSAHAAPLGFYDRPLACKLMKIGRQYSQLFEERRRGKTLRSYYVLQPVSLPIREGPKLSSPEGEGHDELIDMR